jgi:hypothetical protein
MDLRSGIAGIVPSALAVGSTFTVTTMAGFQEGWQVGGRRLIGALVAAFSTGQIAALVGASDLARADGRLAAPPGAAALLLVVSAAALRVRRPPGPLLDR